MSAATFDCPICGDCEVHYTGLDSGSIIVHNDVPHPDDYVPGENHALAGDAGGVDNRERLAGVDWFEVLLECGKQQGFANRLSMHILRHMARAVARVVNDGVVS